MKNQKSKKGLSFWMIVPVFLLVIVFGGLVFQSVSAANGGAAGLVPCGNGNDPAERCTLCHLVLGFKGIIDWGFRIFVVVALLMLVVGGVMYIISAGDQGMIKTAKGVLTNTLFGFAFVLLAWLLVNFTIMLLGANVGVDTTDKTWYNFTCEAPNFIALTPVTDATSTSTPAATSTPAPTPAATTGSTPTPLSITSPTFSPVGGDVASPQTVTISSAATGSTIYYTDDGTDPTAQSPKYTAPITVTVGTDNKAVAKTIKAMAVDASANQSAIVSATYNLSLKCKFIYGNQTNPDFIFVLMKSNKTSGGACGSAQQWANDAADSSLFDSTALTFAKGIDFSQSSGHFAVYQSPLTDTGVSAKDNSCPSASLVSYGYIGKGTESRAYADTSANFAAYCTDDVSPYVFAHEHVGHILGRLQDEYVEEGKRICDFTQRGDMINYNCTADASCSKWKSITSGCYAGCLYQSSGVYRSVDNGIMNSAFDSTKFDVLNEKIIENIAAGYPSGPSYLEEDLCK